MLFRSGAGGEGFLPMLANGTANADAAFPTFVAKLLPAGVKGLVVCGIPVSYTHLDVYKRQ